MTLTKNIQSGLRVIILSIITSGLLFALLFGSRNGFPETIDIQLYDTYFVVSPLLILIHLILWFAFLTAWLIQVFKKHRYTSLHIIKLSSSGLLLTYLITSYRSMFLMEGISTGEDSSLDYSKLIQNDFSKLVMTIILLLALSIILTVFRMIRYHKENKQKA